MPNLEFGTQWVTIQVVAVQQMAGRAHEYVRVFGYLTDAVGQRIVEVAVSPDQAIDIITDAETNKQFCQIEVPSWAYSKVMDTRNVDVVSINGNAGEPPLPPRRGA